MRSIKDTKNVNWNKKYLARCVIWDWHDSNHINVLDERGKISLILNEWQTLVFHEANGNKTIEDIISWFPSQYKNREAVPSQYSENILTVAEELLFKMKFLNLWDRKDDLAYYFELPKKDQDEVESLRLMKEDGLII